MSNLQSQTEHHLDADSVGADNVEDNIENSSSHNNEGGRTRDKTASLNPLFRSSTRKLRVVMFVVPEGMIKLNLLRQKFLSVWMQQYRKCHLC